MNNQGISSPIIILSLILLLVTIIPDLLKAQRTQLDRERVPKAVLAAIQSDFPAWDINRTQWYTYDKGAAEWAPVEDGKEHYLVDGTGKNYKVRAVYNGKGKLLHSKTILENVALPPAILDELSKGEYKDWNIVGSQEVIRNFQEDQKYYNVKIEKDGKRKTVKMDYLGTEVQPIAAG